VIGLRVVVEDCRLRVDSRSGIREGEKRREEVEGTKAVVES
jgi:hypothetical protein